MSSSIAGIIVTTRPERSDEVRRRLDDVAGVEVHASGDNGNIVVTVEGDGTRSLADTMGSLQKVEGVLSTALVYCYDDSTPGGDDPTGFRRSDLSGIQMTNQQEVSAHESDQA